MADFGFIRKAVQVPLHVIAIVQVALLAKLVQDLIVQDAVGRPLLAENLGLPFLACLMLIVTVFLMTWRKEVTLHAIVESALAAIVLTSVASCRLFSVLASNSEEADLAIAVGGLGMTATVLLGIWLYCTVWDNSDILRLRQDTAEDSGSLQESDGNETPEPRPPSAAVDDLQPPPSPPASMSRAQAASDGDFDTDCEPPPYSLSTADNQPLLANT
ncbi:uncharacterized protein LOC135814077 [Sycon ciliatum]|uniref:uncharacterized protein LOC135814077 n=1 Tax=Sycon ciliatum TaxID=27933 RepID=UPI0031F64D63